MILVYVLGIGSRELWLLKMTGTMERAEVVKELSPKEFMLHTPKDGDIHAVFCDKLPVHAGMVIRKIKFEYHIDCLSVRESGLSYFLEQGEINHGRNSNPYPNPHAVTIANSNPD